MQQPFIGSVKQNPFLLTWLRLGCEEQPLPRGSSLKHQPQGKAGLTSNDGCQGCERAALAGIINPWLAIKESVICSILGNICWSEQAPEEPSAEVCLGFLLFFEHIWAWVQNVHVVLKKTLTHDICQRGEEGRQLGDKTHNLIFPAPAHPLSPACQISLE